MNPQQDERVLRRERIHPGVFGLPVMLLVFLLIPTLPMAFFLNTIGPMLRGLVPQQSSPALSFLWVPFVLIDALPVMAVFLAIWLAYLHSEVILTNRRLLYRTGIIARASGEIRLESVEGIFVLEPLLGRLLGYGTVTVSTLGGLRFPVHYLGRPHVFHAALQNAVNASKSSRQPVGQTVPPVDDDSRYMPKA